MTRPTAVNMKFKFPAFRNIDNGTIEFAIEEAMTSIGNADWIDDANQTLALMYYSGHLLQVAIMRGATPTGQLLTSERAPDLGVSYSTPQQSRGEDYDYSMTWYGIRYNKLRDSNFPAVLVAGSAVQM